MKYLVILIGLLSLHSFAQNKRVKTFYSKELKQTRKLIIQEPEVLDSTKHYPLLIALDGDYLSFSLNGEVALYSYFDKIPECIVVSIPQNYLDTTRNKFKRWIDCDYDWKTGLPEKEGIAFQKFIVNELVPYLDKNYRLAPFKGIVGHSFTANYINYFLLDQKQTFTGFGAISPYYADNSLDTIMTTLNKINRPIRYFVSVGEKDLRFHKKSVDLFKKRMKQIKNEKLSFAFYDVKNNGATHYTIVPKSIPYLIEQLFMPYTAIGDEEFKVLLKTKDKLNYLVEKYAQIETVYGAKLKYREEDMQTVAYALYKKKQWNQIYKLGELQLSVYPDSFMGFYTLGEYFEHKKEFQKALAYYEKGFAKLGEEVANKNDFKVDIDRVKKKLK